MAPSVAAAATAISTDTTSGARRRSLSGASALLARRFTRQSSHNNSSSAPRPTASRSESTSRRRATIASTTQLTQEQLDAIKVHVRIVPNIENPSRSLIFDIVDRELNVGSVIRVGRYSERHANINCMSFKSKVVSRCHCEVWVETDGKLYIRDTKSSSGTFLNHVRLSPAGNESRPVELNDGDIVQLGVDFQGGREEMYRSVKMRFELNRSINPRPLSYNLNAFQNLRNLTQQPPQQQITPPAAAATAPVDEEQQEEQEQPPVENTELTHQKTCSTTVHHAHIDSNNELDECCICLYALAPFQALFVSPCSHTYHFKCIRPLLLSYPGFQCPICRTYSDLEASVAIETDEVIEKYQQPNNSNNNNRTTVIMDDTTTNAPPADSGLGLQSMISPSSDIILHDDDNQPLSDINMSPSTTSSSNCSSDQPIPNLHVSNTFISTTTTSPPVNNNNTNYTTCSEITPDVSPLLLDHSITNHHTTNLPNDNQVIEDSSITNDSMIEGTGITSNTEDDEDEEEIHNIRPRERRTSHIMDKIKMVFFEKRKSVSTTAGNSNKNRRSNTNKSRQRPLSYPNLIDDMEQSSSSNNNTSPLDQTLSRQSTTHLTEESTTTTSRPSATARTQQQQQQAMIVDG